MNNRKPSLAERVSYVETSINGTNGAIGLREQLDNLREDMRSSFKKLEENQLRIQENTDKISHKVASMIGGIGALIMILQLIIKLF